MKYLARLLVALSCGALLVFAVHAQERITLSSPKPLPPQVTAYTMSQIRLTVEPTPQVVLVVRGEDGLQMDVVWDGPVAATMIQQINRANLTTRSLTQRLFDRAVMDGKILGTVGGSVP